jgi:signal transduction histidine kinase
MDTEHERTSRLTRLGVVALSRPWWQRITPRLILLVLLVSTVPPLMLGVLTMRSSMVAQQAEVLERNLAVANSGVDKVQSYLDNLVENMRLLIEVGNFQAINPTSARPLLSFLLSFTEDLKELSLIDAQGNERVRIAEGAMVTSEELGSHKGEPMFTSAMAGKVYIGQVRRSEFSEPFVTVAVPISSLMEDKVVGVLAAEVNLKRLWDEVLSFKGGQGGYLYLVNQTGQLLAHPDLSLVLAQKDLSGAGAVEQFLKAEDEDKPEQGIRYRNYQGTEVLGVYRRMDKVGWGIIVEQPTADAFATVDRMKIETSLILLNTVIVTVVLAMLYARRLTRSLGDLAQGARALGAGDFSHRIAITTTDEIGEVAERFNAMADQVRESFQRLHTVLETSRMTSSSLELEHVLATALEQMDHLSGRSLSGIALLEDKMSDHEEIPVSLRTRGGPQDMGRLSINRVDYAHLWRSLSGKQHLVLTDLATATPAESALWQSQGIGAILLLPLVSKEEVLGALWIGRSSAGDFPEEEIALGQTVANHVAIAIDNARLYDELRHTSEELGRSERLALIGQLAGGVGHELRNPLGAIGNAAYYLRMKLGQGGDPKVQKHLGILEEETRRANKIVTELLDFSRVKQPNRVPADLAELVTAVLGREALGETIRVVTEIPSGLPQVQVDPDQVTQVLLNLVHNAAEAMPSGGTLTIRATAGQGWVHCGVIDTGVGIPDANMGKIFQPLFTTKTRGIGLGLAISRRLAETNGGTLTVESREGEGSTFTLTLPVAETSPSPPRHEDSLAHSHRG